MPRIEADLPDGLRGAFTYSQARETGLSKRRLYALRDAGEIEVIGRGIYRRSDDADAADADLLELVLRAPHSTLCLASALARHGLIDLVPATIDVALPRGHRRPPTAAPVIWHTFARDTFDLGRHTLAVDSAHAIGIYEPRRCLVDMFRLRHREGSDLAYSALRQWLATRGSSPSSLLEMARRFPQAEPAIRRALEVLLAWTG